MAESKVVVELSPQERTDVESVFNEFLNAGTSLPSDVRKELESAIVKLGAGTRVEFTHNEFSHALHLVKGHRSLEMVRRNEVKAERLRFLLEKLKDASNAQ